MAFLIVEFLPIKFPKHIPAICHQVIALPYPYIFPSPGPILFHLIPPMPVHFFLYHHTLSHGKSHLVLFFQNFLKYFSKLFSKFACIFCRKVVSYTSFTCGLMVKRLRRRPLTAETRVRFPVRSSTKQLRKIAAVFLLPISLTPFIKSIPDNSPACCPLHI